MRPLFNTVTRNQVLHYRLRAVRSAGNPTHIFDSCNGRQWLESAPGASRRTQPCRPSRPLRSRSNAPTRPVCSPSGYPTRQISHSAPVAPCTAHLCPTPCAQHVQPLNVPVREPVHVQYWAVAWSDRVGLLGLALALRARADIEVCAAGEDAASQQGSSTDGQARSWLARR